MQATAEFTITLNTVLTTANAILLGIVGWFWRHTFQRIEKALDRLQEQQNGLGNRITALEALRFGHPQRRTSDWIHPSTGEE